MLRAEYDAWRATHACPASSPDGGPGTPDAGPGGDGGAAATDAGLGGEADDAGCGCQAAGRTRGGLGGAWLLLFAAAALRRARAR
jgi:hypothetical protein